MNKTLIARSRSINWNKALSILLMVALLVPLMVRAPALEAGPRVQPLLLEMAAERPEEIVGVIVQKLVKDASPSTGSGHRVEELVVRMGGVITKDLHIINAFAAELPAKAVPKLATAAGVRWVSLDAPVVAADDVDEDDDGSGGSMTLRDEFNAASYNDNDGAVNWTGDWVEIGESDGPEVGDIAVTSFLGGTRRGLRIQNANKGVRREANLSGATSAVVSFDYRRKGFDDSSDHVVIEISADGGASWKELDRFEGPATDLDVQFASYDISSHVSSNTAIRFVSSSSLGEQDKLYIDNVHIEYTLADDSSLNAVTSESTRARDSFDAMINESQLASSQGSGGGTETVRDEFNAVSYSNNDGTQNWSGDWVEDDPEAGGAGPTAGQVWIIDGELRLDDHPDTGGEPSVGRKVDLSGGVTAATFSFDSRTSWGVDWDDAIAVEVSSDGGTNYTVLETITGIWGETWGWRSYDITGYISADTMIRFRVSNKYGGSDEYFFVDNVQIEYTVTPESTPSAGPFAKINFQPPSAPVPSGYEVDSGATYGDRGNGFTYGWDATNDETRDRNNGASPDQRYDTLNHMQKHGANHSWEIAVPNGTYDVYIVAGDPSYTDSTYGINVEGVLAVNGAPSSAQRWLEGFVTVTVTDGKLTVSNASGSSNNKINFIQIDAVVDGGDPQPPAGGGSFETVRDEFNAICFSNNDGTVNWTADWVEDDPEAGGAGPTAGQVRIVDGELRLDNSWDTGGEPSAARQVDLSGGVTAATFSFDFRTSWGVDTDDAIAVEVSSDGGTNYTVLETITGIWGATWGSRSFDISGYISADTMIRFRVANKYGGSDEFFFADNVQIEYAGGCAECIDTSNLAGTYVQAIGADQLWNEALYLQGQGVTVAVVDSGIAPHDDLLDGVGNSRVVAQVDLTGGQGLPDDYHGHGSHIAGTIGGSGAKSDGTYIGVAPKVNLVDVMVLDDQGAGTTSDVVAGLQWIYDHKDEYNIRVVNLSLNSSHPESYHASPLDAALEILWFNNIVVVVSAGNNGNGPRGTLYPPANDPFVITVGATDDMGTADTGDDVLAPFSAYGKSQGGFDKPDLVAPGTDIISLLASDDCNLVIAHPAHAVAGPDGNYYFRMSGTSMASAVTAGAVALLLQDEPDLTPDQVKHRLMATAQPFDGPEPSSTGAGYLDIYAAVHGTTTGSANTAKITFTSHRDGNSEIYVMDAGGSNQTRLTSNAASDDRPAWSPDRSKIAFASDRDGNWEIYVMDADGSNPVNLTNHAYNDRYPVWSPDGSQIAFYRYYPDNWEIYVMDADGANQTRLTFNAASDSYPAWSPDGSQIAFHSDRDGNYEIYVMGADGSNQTNLTNNGAEDGAPAWSPDGSQIAFRSMRDGNKEIYVMGADGSNQTRLTNNGATDNDPAWSPGGSQIAFHSDRDGNYEIYVMNADGTNLTRLSNNAAYDLEPAWSPGVVPHQLLAKMALMAYWASENGGDSIDWDSVNWDSVNWDSVNWDSVNWDSVNWDSVNWDSVNWDSVNWDSVNWDSVNWDSVNWDSVNWDSVNWDSVNWDSVNWDD